ncbi:MAG TPA: class I SAM-dependent methyltransferase [Afifellaceae bacterium]|nr:class I SAM-dependent methyltransferase [Afifellaceae bacterium]
MTQPFPGWSEAVPGPLAPALIACAAGTLPANVALMRLIGEAAEECAAQRALAAALAACEAAGQQAETERLRRLEALWRGSPGAWRIVKAVFAEADHDSPAEGGEAAIARWAAVFDRLAKLSPEASVALYSLGRSDLLDAATDELVRLLRSWGLLDRQADVLDLGCGIGRLAAALAGEVGSVIGIDVAPAMIAAARRRCAGLANIRLMQTAGQDLSAFADGSFDLVLAVDVFPYLVQAGMEVAARHVREAARVLKDGGALLIFNFSYRGDLETDGADVSRLARAGGLTVIGAGSRDLSLWDGAAFRLAKPEIVPSLDMDVR